MSRIDIFMCWHIFISLFVARDYVHHLTAVMENYATTSGQSESTSYKQRYDLVSGVFMWLHPCALITEWNWMWLISGLEPTALLSCNHRRPRKQIALRQQTQNLRYKAEELNCSFLNWTENFCDWFLYSVKNYSILTQDHIALLHVYTHWHFPYIRVSFVHHL